MDLNAAVAIVWAHYQEDYPDSDAAEALASVRDDDSIDDDEIGQWAGEVEGWEPIITPEQAQAYRMVLDADDDAIKEVLSSL